MQEVAELQFEILRPIGVGQGMNSQVFLAHDPQLNGDLAVKQIPKTNLGNTVTGYFQEAHTMFATSHPNVVPVQYACQTPTHVCLAMPYFPAGSLSDKLKGGPLPVAELLRVAQDTLNGVSRIHSKNFLHLDLKPSNVFFMSTGTALVADFGQARAIGANGVVTAPAMYRWAFPPETAQQGIATIRSDVFQVGLLLYRAANGDGFYKAQLPDPASLVGYILSGRFPDRSKFMPHVSKRLRTIIRAALKLDPAERFATASEMAAVLGRADLGLSWTVVPGTNGEITWRASRGAKPALTVELLRDTKSPWAVQVHKGDGAARRAVRRAEYWGRFPTVQKAFEHLKPVFEDLQA